MELLSFYSSSTAELTGVILSRLVLSRCRVWGESTAVTQFTLRSPLPLVRCTCLCLALIKGRDCTSAPSSSTQKTPGRGECLRFLCAASVGLHPSFSSFTLWPNLCFSHLLSGHLAVLGKAEAEFGSSSKSRQQYALWIDCLYCLAPFSSVDRPRSSLMGEYRCAETCTMKVQLSVDYKHLC